MILIVGQVAINPERRDEAVALARWMSEQTEREPGCRRYRFAADLDDPGRFHLIEEWDDEEALAAHFRTPHMATFSARLPGLIAAPPDVMRYDIAARRPL